MALAHVPGRRLSGLTTAGTLASLACRHAGLLCTRVGGSSSSSSNGSGSSRSGDGGSHTGSGSRSSSSSSDTSSSGGSNARGGGEAASGRACERPEAARRDVSVDRLTALESEVLALRKALSALQQQQGQGQQQQGQQEQGQRQHGKGHQGQEQQGEQGEQGRQGQEQQQRQQQQEQRGKMRYQEEHAHGASGGAAGGNGGDSDEGAVSKAATAAAAGDGAGATEAVAEGLGKLHPRITRLVQSGYLESMHHLRQRLMVDEWEGGGRQRAGRRGVADFEAQLAAGEHDGGGDGGGGGGGGQGGGGGGEEGAPGQGGGGRSAPPLTWEQLTQLYEAPDPVKALEAVIPDPRLRMAARATLHRALDERHEKVHDGATALAKELADSVARGPGDLLGGLFKLLPLPSFLQPK